MRITSRNAISFDIDGESTASMAILMRDVISELLTEQLQVELIGRIASKVMEDWSDNSLAEQISRYVNTADISAYISRTIVSDLLNDTRFNSRMMRHIGEATIGVTNEAVERVSAIIKSQTTSNGDV